GGVEGVGMGDARAAALFHGARLARPFAEPGIVVADPAPEAEPDAMDLADLRPAPGSHVEPDQQPVRPAVILRKVGEGQFLPSSVHTASLPAKTSRGQDKST